MPKITKDSDSLFPLICLIPFSLACLIFSSSVIADTDENLEFENLLNLLSQQTNIATNSRLNVDYVPGMISVLNGEELVKWGIKDLWQAMPFIPGIQQHIDATGMRTIVVRGVGRSLNAPKVKLLLNNVAINSSSSATTGTLFDIPINQIERVEFIRGPGSAIHGEFAFAGVINVITRKTGTQYGLGFDSNESTSIHTLLDINPSSETIHGSINISAYGSNGETLKSGEDKTPTGISDYSPGNINNKKDHISAILDLRLAEIDILFQYQQSNRGDHFGLYNYLPPDVKQTVISDTIATLKISQPFQVSEKLSGNWSLGQVRNSTDKNKLFLGVAEIYGGTINDEDIVADVRLEEHRNEAAVDFTYEIDSHKIYLEWSLADISVEEYQQYINLDPSTMLPDNLMNEFPTPISPGRKRNINSLVFQDEFAFNDSQTLTAGIRHDDYDDIGSNLSPRLALVWRITDEEILKFQYSEAFRPPSLLETDGAIDNSINPEIIRMLETSYIINNADYLIRNTLYYADIEDLIVYHSIAPFGYENLQHAKIYGYEIELTKTFGSDLKLSTNLGLQGSSNISSRLYRPSRWLASAAVDYRIAPYESANLLIHGNSELDRLSSDEREPLQQSPQVDLTYLKNRFLGSKSLQLSIGLKNIFGEEIRYAAPEQTYPDDYLYSQDPSLWLELDYGLSG